MARGLIRHQVITTRGELLTGGDVRDSFPYFSVIGIEIMSCKTALGKEKLVCSGKILKDTLHLIILKMLQKRKWQEIRKGEIGDGIEKLSGLSVGLFVGSIGLSFWLFVGDIFAYLSETLAKKVGAFVPSTEVADPRAANRETGYKVCF